MAWMIVRVRGTIHARTDVVETLRYLHLTRANHATVVPETPSFRGMLSTVQGYVTWGEAEPATVGKLLAARGRTSDGRPLGEAGGTAGAPPELAQGISTGGLSAAPGVRPLFRLKAPRGGWRSTKKPFTLGGALGYRGRQINALVEKML